MKIDGAAQPERVLAQAGGLFPGLGLGGRIVSRPGPRLRPGKALGASAPSRLGHFAFWARNIVKIEARTEAGRLG